jgi:hypothetical protein
VIRLPSRQRLNLKTLNEPIQLSTVNAPRAGSPSFIASLSLENRQNAGAFQRSQIISRHRRDDLSRRRSRRDLLRQIVDRNQSVIGQDRRTIDRIP